MDFPIILTNNILMDTVDVASATNISAQVSNILMLNGTNFKVWKDTVDIIIGCMDLDKTL